MLFFGFSGSLAGNHSFPALVAYGNGSQGANSAASPSWIAGKSCSALWAEQFAQSDGAALAFHGAPEAMKGPGATDYGRVSAADLLARYRVHGRGFLDGVAGRFSLALVDTDERRVVLAVDPMGIERMTYSVVGNGIVFSSSAEAVARFPSVRASLHQQALFDYLLLHMVPSPTTVYERVQKLQCGTAVWFENGRTSTRRYWNPQFTENGLADTKALREQLFDALAQGISNCEPDDSTGAFLSGGLDSSTVVGMLGRVTAARPKTFSMGFGVDEYNEIAYARIASKRFDAVSVEYDVKPEDVVTAFPLIAAAYDEPFGNSSAVPTYMCAKIARDHGVDHLLAGDGGDELFGGNERYARQGVFEKYAALPGVLRRHLIEPLTDRISPSSRAIPLRKMRSYVDQARIPMPERLEYWNFMYQTDLGTLFEGDFLASIDSRAPYRLMAELYGAAPAESLVNRMLFYDWQYTLSDNDLRKVGTMCDLAGVRVSYPMLHPAVIAVSNQVPPSLKVRGDQLRVFYKDSMRGFLPNEILAKQKHGFGLPFGVWLREHRPLAELIFSQLSELKARRIIRPGLLDQLIDDQRAGHASYFGYAIWDLAMLEAWLSAHGH